MKKSKYRNKKVGIDDYKFDSIKEANHYQGLKICLANGIISDLIVHPRFLIHAGFVDAAGVYHRPIYYAADFQYKDNESGKIMIVDVKGMLTDVYKIKKKLFLKQLPKNSIFVEA